MNKYNKWTDEQIEFVLKLREEGLTWNAIARRLEQTYSVKKTGANIRNKIVWFVEKQNQNKEEEEMKIPENYEPATKKQCRYYANLTTDDNTTKKDINTITNTLYSSSLKGQLSKSFLRNAIAELVGENQQTKKSTVKVVSKHTPRNQKRWSAAEDKILLQKMYDCEITNGMKKSVCEELVDSFDNRTKFSISARWSKLKKGGQTSKYISFKRQMIKDILVKKNEIRPKAETLPEKIEVFVEKHGNPTTRHLSNAEKKMFREVNEVLEALPERKHERSQKHWKNEEEFELLCNFYELSIDEARNQFGRSYASLAQRLEMIVDSEQPEHIAMLKKAAKVISKRKKEEAKNTNMSRWKRRRIARKAKKAAKLEKKLNKLRGV
jgi:hypothetical protein